MICFVSSGPPLGRTRSDGFGGKHKKQEHQKHKGRQQNKDQLEQTQNTCLCCFCLRPSFFVWGSLVFEKMLLVSSAPPLGQAGRDGHNMKGMGCARRGSRTRKTHQNQKSKKVQRKINKQQRATRTPPKVRCAWEPSYCC